MQIKYKSLKKDKAKVLLKIRKGVGKKKKEMERLAQCDGYSW